MDALSAWDYRCFANDDNCIVICELDCGEVVVVRAVSREMFAKSQSRIAPEKIT